MICALIMAGGKGTRFWPLSTEERPKQFLNLIGERTMIQMTVDRISKKIPMDRIFICTGQEYIDLVKEQLPEIPDRNIIIEPNGRNTTPCIALSALIIKRYYGNAKMLVLPSDHLINDTDKFIDNVLDGCSYLEKNNEAIVTLGIMPTRPETGYGYIKYSNVQDKIKNSEILKVNSFVEKPNKIKAMEYIKEGNYLWNAGMFIFKTENILKQIEKYSTSTYEALKDILNIDEKSLQKYIDENYYKTEAISIDYAILEKYNKIFVIKSSFKWDDVGSFEAINRYGSKDLEGNICLGHVDSLNATNNIVISKNNNVIIHGLNDIYVIENDGHILIGKKDEIDKIKKLKEKFS